MFDSVSSVALQSALDGLAMRQRVIADNVANIQTPGYHAQKVSFEDALSKAVSHGSGAVTAHVARSLEPTRMDGNNVNLDEETLLERRHEPPLPAGVAGDVERVLDHAHRDEDELMTIFGAIGIASTGLTVHRKWLDAVSDNLANVSTVRPHERGGVPAEVRGRPGDDQR